jgi:hypothetical protein
MRVPCTNDRHKMHTALKHGPSAGIPELDEIVLAARHEKAHRRMPFNTLDVPSMASKDKFLPALRKDQTCTVESSLAVAKQSSLGKN